MTQLLCESQVLVQEFEQDFHKNSEELPLEYEIDSEHDADFGELFRIWKGWIFLGTFYQALDGKWIAQAVNASIDGRFDTSAQVITLIIAIHQNPHSSTS